VAMTRCRRCRCTGSIVDWVPWL